MSSDKGVGLKAQSEKLPFHQWETEARQRSDWPKPMVLWKVG